MRTGPAYDGLHHRGSADDVEDEVGAALEEQVEEPPAADEAHRTAEQSDETRLVEPGRAGRLDGLADPGGDRAARPELPRGIEPLVAVANGEQLAEFPQALDLAEIDAEPTREPGPRQRSREDVVDGMRPFLPLVVGRSIGLGA
jgi:hypothetical protein